MSYVRLPSSRSYSPMMTSLNGLSLQWGWTQPPSRKSLVGSSSGPPGACMTPSIEMKTAPVSLRIDGFPRRRGLNGGDIDLAHRHHRLECPFRLRRIGNIGGQIEQTPGRNLPREAPSVLAPAAGAFLAAALDYRVPISVRLRLVFGHDDEADRLVGFEQRTSVQAQEPPSKHRELDGQLVALLPVRKIGR